MIESGGPGSARSSSRRARVRRVAGAGAADARIPLAERIAGDPTSGRRSSPRTMSGIPLDIRRIDEAWIHNPRFPLRKTLTSGPCADRLRKLVAGDKLIVEAFLMDERGGLAAAPSRRPTTGKATGEVAEDVPRRHPGLHRRAGHGREHGCFSQSN